MREDGALLGERHVAQPRDDVLKSLRLFERKGSDSSRLNVRRRSHRARGGWGEESPDVERRRRRVRDIGWAGRGRRRWRRVARVAIDRREQRCIGVVVGFVIFGFVIVGFVVAAV